MFLALAAAWFAISCQGEPAIDSHAVVATNAAVAATNAAAGLAARTRWSESFLGRNPTWYASAEAREIADTVLQYQTDQGA